jgi:hypothetical protein
MCLFSAYMHTYQRIEWKATDDLHAYQCILTHDANTQATPRNVSSETATNANANTNANGDGAAHTPATATEPGHAAADRPARAPQENAHANAEQKTSNGDEGLRVLHTAAKQEHKVPDAAERHGAGKPSSSEAEAVDKENSCEKERNGGHESADKRVVHGQQKENGHESSDKGNKHDSSMQDADEANKARADATDELCSREQQDKENVCEKEQERKQESERHSTHEADKEEARERASNGAPEDAKASNGMKIDGNATGDATADGVMMESDGGEDAARNNGLHIDDAVMISRGGDAAWKPAEHQHGDVEMKHGDHVEANSTNGVHGSEENGHLRVDMSGDDAMEGVTYNGKATGSQKDAEAVKTEADEVKAEVEA